MAWSVRVLLIIVATVLLSRESLASGVLAVAESVSRETASGYAQSPSADGDISPNPDASPPAPRQRHCEEIRPTTTATPDAGAIHLPDLASDGAADARPSSGAPTPPALTGCMNARTPAVSGESRAQPGRLTPLSRQSASGAQIGSGFPGSPADSLRDSGLSGGLADDLGAASQSSLPDTAESGRRSPFWARAIGARKPPESTGENAGFRAATGGIAVGGDTRLEHWAFGTSVSYASMNDNRGGNRGFAGTYRISSYAIRHFSGYYLGGQTEYASGAASPSPRNAPLAGMPDRSANNTAYAFRIIAGVPYSLGENCLVTTLAGLSTGAGSADAFSGNTTTPATAAQERSSSSLNSTLGFKISSEYKLGHAVTAKPVAMLSWRREFKSDSTVPSPAFNGAGPAPAFAAPGQNQPRNTYALSLGSSMETARQFSLSVLLNTGNAARYSAWSGQVQGAWRF